MIDTTFTDRLVIANKDWATILFLLTIVLVAILKTNFENRFSDFSKLIVSNKYVQTYKDGSQIMSLFTVLLFIIHLISVSFFCLILLSEFGNVSKYDGLVFIQIVTVFTVFILSKFLIEKIVATTFNIEDYVDYLNLNKVNYRTHFALLLLPFNIILFFNDNVRKEVFYAIIFILLFVNTIVYLNVLKKQQNLLISKIIYFILYLCALEIAPYYFIYRTFYNKLIH
jgi:hypothetical protein